MNPSEVFEHCGNIVVSLCLTGYAVRQLRMSLTEGKRDQLHWRVAYVIAFSIACLFFLQPEPHAPSPWHPPTFHQLVAWPAVLFWPCIVAGVYACLGEWRSKRGGPKSHRAGFKPTAT